ncbi:hypothetical protein F0562_031842 [Nyssa sinensis]|uniref:Uncharacterized protein n=1 Tax=Nyssa sinensis TaxID=561372 RepID=A0A5J5AZC4_9ASTE|nr:hypothetical protein F0562_031842 [Nyssa sinensis]
MGVMAATTRSGGGGGAVAQGRRWWWAVDGSVIGRWWGRAMGVRLGLRWGREGVGGRSWWLWLLEGVRLELVMMEVRWATGCGSGYGGTGLGVGCCVDGDGATVVVLMGYCGDEGVATGLWVMAVRLRDIGSEREKKKERSSEVGFRLVREGRGRRRWMEDGGDGRFGDCYGDDGCCGDGMRFRWWLWRYGRWYWLGAVVWSAVVVRDGAVAGDGGAVTVGFSGRWGREGG